MLSAAVCQYFGSSAVCPAAGHARLPSAAVYQHPCRTGCRSQKPPRISRARSNRAHAIIALSVGPEFRYRRGRARRIMSPQARSPAVTYFCSEPPIRRMILRIPLLLRTVLILVLLPLRPLREGFGERFSFSGTLSMPETMSVFLRIPPEHRDLRLSAQHDSE